MLVCLTLSQNLFSYFRVKGGPFRFHDSIHALWGLRQKKAQQLAKNSRTVLVTDNVYNHRFSASRSERKPRQERQSIVQTQMCKQAYRSCNGGTTAAESDLPRLSQVFTMLMDLCLSRSASVSLISFAGHD